MKNVTLLALAAGLLVSVAACGGPEVDVPAPNNPTSDSPSLTAAPATPPVRVEDMEITLRLSLLGVPADHTGVYTGETVDGLPHGHGSFATTNARGKARTYVGDWDRGHLSGEGRWEHASGRVVARGTYEDDLLVTGTLYYGDGLVRYEGGFTDGLPDMDAAARQTRVDEYDKIAVHADALGEWQWSDYLGQIMLDQVRLEQIVPDVASYLLVYAGGAGTANYFPAYGEPLPQPGDTLRKYVYSYSETAPDTGVVTIYQDLMALVIQ